MSKILVTGGTGCIGSHLVRSLLADGLPVRVLTRSIARSRERVPAEVELVEGDVANPETAPRIVKGCSIVYHLAGPFRESNIPDQRYRDVQVDGVRYMLEAARAEGVERYVHVSTIGVLGHIEHPPADETTAYNPGDIYQITKTEGEKLVLEFQRKHNFPLTVARPASVYGPGDLRFLKLFKSIKKGWFVMLGKGDVLLHLVHLDDLVRGLRMLAVDPKAIGEVFIIGGPSAHSLNDLTRMIAEVLDAPAPKLHLPVWPVQMAGSLCEAICVPLGITPPIYRRRVDFFTKSRSFKLVKAARVLGYTPRVSLMDGLRNTAEWYRATGRLS